MVMIVELIIKLTVVIEMMWCRTWRLTWRSTRRWPMLQIQIHINKHSKYSKYSDIMGDIEGETGGRRWRKLPRLGGRRAKCAAMLSPT